ncbi:MAG: hypothetical protein HYZ31_03255 [Gammaproteobacteria bacterium]|nr:hypothetical protein [Gammaproteobacteria bacterium]
MHTPRFINTLLIMFPTLLCFTGIATAAEQTYVREYIYQASEADSKLSARAIALQEVKRTWPIIVDCSIWQSALECGCNTELVVLYYVRTDVQGDV